MVLRFHDEFVRVIHPRNAWGRKKSRPTRSYRARTGPGARIKGASHGGGGGGGPINLLMEQIDIVRGTAAAERGGGHEIRHGR